MRVLQCIAHFLHDQVPGWPGSWWICSPLAGARLAAETLQLYLARQHLAKVKHTIGDSGPACKIVQV